MIEITTETYLLQTDRLEMSWKKAIQFYREGRRRIYDNDGVILIRNDTTK